MWRWIRAGVVPVVGASVGEGEGVAAFAPALGLAGAGDVHARAAAAISATQIDARPMDAGPGAMEPWLNIPGLDRSIPPPIEMGIV